MAETLKACEEQYNMNIYVYMCVCLWLYIIYMYINMFTLIKLSTSIEIKRVPACWNQQHDPQYLRPSHVWGGLGWVREDIGDQAVAFDRSECPIN